MPPKAMREGTLGDLPRPVMTRLGLQNTDDADVLKKVSTINGYTFTVCPANKYHSQQAEQKFASLAGGINPVFNPDRFDALRQKLQTSEKREKDSGLQAIAVLYSEELSKKFAKAKDIDYAAIERMYFPTYLPTYDEILKSHGMKKPLFWRPGSFTNLENMARIPLDRCTETREAKMSFEEWYNLFWNYYNPFSPLEFTCLCTAQSMMFSQEFVNSFADYLALRHASLDDSMKKNPILFFGPRIGKYGAFLNATKKVPVPIIHVHESPNTNPYLLAIPNELQADFKPMPIQKMSYKQALEKYEPSMVIFSDMKTHTDETAMIRATGSVREYITLGIPDGYAEGAGWDTWGYSRYRPKDASSMPPYLADGWGRLNLHHLSRWLVHKNDSEMQMGTAAAVSFMRRPVIPAFSYRLKNFHMARLRPFF